MPKYDLHIARGIVCQGSDLIINHFKTKYDPMTDILRLAIDFDGTIAEHEFPRIGPAVPGAFEWLKKFKEAGATLILWTMRCDGRLEHPFVLSEAVDFCRANGIEFDAVNEGINDRNWTDSPKIFSHLYIDDAAFGCPLIQPEGRRAYVNWEEIGPAVMEMLNHG